MFKKSLSLILVLGFLIYVLAACSNEKDEPTKTPTKPPVQTSPTATEQATASEDESAPRTDTNAAEDSISHLESIRQKKVMVVGTAITRPFEFYDDNGKLVGFDVDLMSKIADELGVEIEWRDMAFADLLTALANGDVDVVIAAMYIRPDREEIVDMSHPYLDAGLVMVVQTNNKTIHSLEDLASKTVGVKEGSTGAKYAQNLIDGGIALEMRIYTDTVASLDDLRDGHLDAVFNDYNNSLTYIQANPQVRVEGEIFDPAGLGISVKTGDVELLEFINATLADLTNTGEIERLFNQWIKPKDQE